MPTYSYRCTECDTAFDIVQAFTDESLTVCPNCEGRLRKVYSAIGVTFNGSGFYRTDSRAGSSASGGSAGSGGSESGGGSGTTSTSAAPAASSSSKSTSSTD